MTYDSRYYKCVNIILYACVFLNNVTVSSVSSIHHCNYKYEGIRVSGYILSFYWPTCKYQIHSYFLIKLVNYDDNGIQ